MTRRRRGEACGQAAEGDIHAEIRRGVVSPLAGIRHHGAGEIAHHRRDIGAGIDDNGEALARSSRPSKPVQSWFCP